MSALLRDRRVFAVLLTALLFSLPVADGQADEIDVKRRTDRIKALQGLSTTELEAHLTGPRDSRAIRVEGEQDFILSEVIKRDKKWSVPLLQKLVDASEKDSDERR